jgi:hypothetical protein
MYIAPGLFEKGSACAAADHPCFLFSGMNEAAQGPFFFKPQAACTPTCWHPCRVSRRGDAIAAQEILYFEKRIFSFAGQLAGKGDKLRPRHSITRILASGHMTKRTLPTISLSLIGPTRALRLSLEPDRLSPQTNT